MEKMKILCYNTDDRIVTELSSMGKKLGIGILRVAPDDFRRPIAAVASEVSSRNNPLSTPSFSEAMLVFVSIPDGMLDVILSVMREKGIRVSLKAVLTPHNALWDANTLYNELCRERRELGGK